MSKARPDGTGSHEPSPKGLGPSGFDPSRDRLAMLHAIRRANGQTLRAIIPEGHRCGPIAVEQGPWDAMTAGHEAEEKALAALMPTEQDAINLLHDAYQRLKKLGWNDAIYCPKDGSEFDAIEVGSTGIFPTHYSGEWPDGHWWAADGGDMWPARPCLYRVSEDEKARWKEAGKKLRALRDELRDSDGSPKGGDACGSVHDSAGPKDIAQ